MARKQRSVWRLSPAGVCPAPREPHQPLRKGAIRRKPHNQAAVSRYKHWQRQIHRPALCRLEKSLKITIHLKSLFILAFFFRGYWGIWSVRKPAGAHSLTLRRPLDLCTFTLSATNGHFLDHSGGGKARWSQRKPLSMYTVTLLSRPSSCFHYAQSKGCRKNSPSCWFSSQCFQHYAELVIDCWWIVLAS